MLEEVGRECGARNILWDVSADHVALEGSLGFGCCSNREEGTRFLVSFYCSQMGVDSDKGNFLLWGRQRGGAAQAIVSSFLAAPTHWKWREKGVLAAKWPLAGQLEGSHLTHPKKVSSETPAGLTP